MTTTLTLRSVWFPCVSDLTNGDLADMAQDQPLLFGGDTEAAFKRALAHAEAEMANHSADIPEEDERMRLVNETTGTNPDGTQWASWVFGCADSDPSEEDAEMFVWYWAQEQAVL